MLAFLGYLQAAASSALGGIPNQPAALQRLEIAHKGGSLQIHLIRKSADTDAGMVANVDQQSILTSGDAGLFQIAVVQRSDFVFGLLDGSAVTPLGGTVALIELVLHDGFSFISCIYTL